MDESRLARMLEATRLTRRARFAEAMALLQQGPAGGGGLPDMPDMPGMPGRSKPRPGPTAPGRFLDLSYASEAGELACKLYVPSAHAAGAVPLIVMLHGGTQSAEDFAAGTRMSHLAERHGFLVAYPEQSRNANPMGYWSWFRPEHQQRGRGEASLIAGLTDEIVDRYALDARRVYVAGFSAGGAMAAVMATAYPDVYAAVGVHSGLAAGAARDLPSAYAAMARGGPTPGTPPVPLIVFHGDSDRTVDHVNADGLVRAALPSSGAHPRAFITTGEVPGGRAYTRQVHSGRDGTTLVEQWTIHDAGHAWSGGSPHGTYTDPQGPDASAELVRFFAQHAQRHTRQRAA
jgi:poly(hydroxyalkanoate) depolymerase family esterase